MYWIFSVKFVDLGDSCTVGGDPAMNIIIARVPVLNVPADMHWARESNRCRTNVEWKALYLLDENSNSITLQHHPLKVGNIILPTAKAVCTIDDKLKVPLNCVGVRWGI